MPNWFNSPSENEAAKSKEHPRDKNLREAEEAAVPKQKKKSKKKPKLVDYGGFGD